MKILDKIQFIIVMLLVLCFSNTINAHAESVLVNLLKDQEYTVNSDGTITVTIDVTDELRKKCEKEGIRLEDVINLDNPTIVLDNDDLDAIAENTGYYIDKSKLPTPTQIMEEAGSLSLLANNSVNASLFAEIKVDNNGDGHAMQNFFYCNDNGYLYITQHNKGDMTISKYYVQRGMSEYRYIDSMKIEDAGHAQTLEQFNYGGKTYFLVSLGVNEVGGMFWSKEIGFVEYQPGTTLKSNTLKRCVDFRVGYGSGDIKRVDAALSSDKSQIVIWKKDNQNKIEISGYYFDDFKKLVFGATSSNPFVSIRKLKKVYSFNNQMNDSSVKFPGSFQGIDVSNMVDNVSSIYIASGKEAINDAEGNIPLTITRYNSKGILKKANQINYLGLNPYKEIEGIHIEGHSLQFGLVPAPAYKGGTVDKDTQYLYVVDKDLF